jgi:hypothetical protein
VALAFTVARAAAASVSAGGWRRELAEFSKRSRQESRFVTRVLERPKVWIIGGEDDLSVAV